MTRSDVVAAAKSAIGSEAEISIEDHPIVGPLRVVRIYMGDDFTLEFCHLEDLARHLGSKVINIVGVPGTPNYSEWTPGDPGSVSIEVIMPGPVTP